MAVYSFDGFTSTAWSGKKWLGDTFVMPSANVTALANWNANGAVFPNSGYPDWTNASSSSINDQVTNFATFSSLQATDINDVKLLVDNVNTSHPDPRTEAQKFYSVGSNFPYQGCLTASGKVLGVTDSTLSVLTSIDGWLTASVTSLSPGSFSTYGGLVYLPNGKLFVTASSGVAPKVMSSSDDWVSNVSTVSVASTFPNGSYVYGAVLTPTGYVYVFTSDSGNDIMYKSSDGWATASSSTQASGVGANAYARGCLTGSGTIVSPAYGGNSGGKSRVISSSNNWTTVSSTLVTTGYGFQHPVLVPGGKVFLAPDSTGTTTENTYCYIINGTSASQANSYAFTTSSRGPMVATLMANGNVVGSGPHGGGNAILFTPDASWSSVTISYLSSIRAANTGILLPNGKIVFLGNGNSGSAVPLIYQPWQDMVHSAIQIGSRYATSPFWNNA